MIFYGLLGDEKFFADFLVAEALRDELNDFFLAVAEQRLFAARTCLAGLRKRLHHFSGHTIVEPDLAGMHAIMLFTRRSVADCFSTTPRAPRRMARTTSRSSSAAVKTTTRVGSVSKLTSSRTAKPSLSGMRRSRRRISGFSLVRSLMHSTPF